MNRPIINKHLPAGLMDSNIEFFVEGTEIYALMKGRVIKFDEFPAEIIDVLNTDIEKHPEALKALIELDLVEPKTMLRQYIRCRFGGFDGEADIENGQLKHTEYWDCGLRGVCKYEGKLCPAIKVDNGYLTKREIEVLKCIAEGMLDKQIAEALNISITTVPTFTKQIREKGGFNRKADMVKFAINKNLI